MNGGFKSVNDTADLIGVTARAIYLRIKGGKFPALPADGGRVDPRAVYDHFCKHGRRPAGLRKPPGYDDVLQTAVNGGDEDEIIKAAMEANIDEVDLHRLVVGLVRIGASDAKVRAVSTAANAIQKKRADAARSGKNLPPDDVARMLRSHGDVMVEHIEGSIPRLATDLLRLVRDIFSIDTTKQPHAVKAIEARLSEDANKTIGAIKTHIEDQCKGVQMLEFTP